MEYKTRRAFGTVLLAFVLAISTFPAPAMAELGDVIVVGGGSASPAPSGELSLAASLSGAVSQTVASLEGKGTAQKLAALWDQLAAGGKVAGETLGPDEAALAALRGEPSTDAGVTRAFALACEELGVPCEEVAADDGSPRALLKLDGDDVEADVANATEGEYPWEAGEPQDDSAAAPEAAAPLAQQESEPEADSQDGQEAEVLPQEEAEAEVTLAANADEVKPSVSYAVHVQNIGNQAKKEDGAVAGTSGRALRLESIWLKLGDKLPAAGGITYRTHVQDIGWQGWKSDGAVSGTQGQAKRLEAIEIKLTGKLAEQYHVYYRVHAQNIGWMGWAKDGETAGTTAVALRLEAIQVVIVKDGDSAPGDLGGIKSADSHAGYANPGLLYHGHVQNIGWQRWVGAGSVAGTTGRSLRVEGLELKLGSTNLKGDIRYRVHVQNIGWQDWVENGALAGTTGRSLRVEALQIVLTDEVAASYDVWYRSHVEGLGWLGWTKNGQSSGTEGYARRMEAVQIQLVPKGMSAPGSTWRSFVGYDPTRSGDPTLDAAVDTFIKQTGTGYNGLRRAYEILSTWPYRTGSHWPGPNWRSWSVGFAKEMWLNRSGNCYRYASLMCWTAIRLGYDAQVVPGWLPTRLGGKADHGWVEVKLNGTSYVIDPELKTTRAYPQYNWFMIKYSQAPVAYHDLANNRITRS